MLWSMQLRLPHHYHHQHILGHVSDGIGGRTLGCNVFHAAIEQSHYQCTIFNCLFIALYIV